MGRLIHQSSKYPDIRHASDLRGASAHHTLLDHDELIFRLSVCNDISVLDSTGLLKRRIWLTNVSALCGMCTMLHNNSSVVYNCAMSICTKLTFSRLLWSKVVTMERSDGFYCSHIHLSIRILCKYFHAEYLNWLRQSACWKCFPTLYCRDYLL